MELRIWVVYMVWNVDRLNPRAWVIGIYVHLSGNSVAASDPRHWRSRVVLNSRLRNPRSDLIITGRRSCTSYTSQWYWRLCALLPPPAGPTVGTKEKHEVYTNTNTTEMTREKTWLTIPPRQIINTECVKQYIMQEMATLTQQKRRTTIPPSLSNK